MLLLISTVFGTVSLALFGYRLFLRFKSISQGERDAVSVLGFTTFMLSFVYASPALAGIF